MENITGKVPVADYQFRINIDEIALAARQVKGAKVTELPELSPLLAKSAAKVAKLLKRFKCKGEVTSAPNLGDVVTFTMRLPLQPMLYYWLRIDLAAMLAGAVALRGTDRRAFLANCAATIAMAVENPQLPEPKAL